QAHYQRLRTAAEAGAPSESRRRAQLQAMLTWTVANQAAVTAAIQKDFGTRSPMESMLAELFIVTAGLRHALGALSTWMAPEPRDVHWAFLPARGELRRQPKGVVAILSPWNYPFHLAVVPLTAAIAAGNRVLLKTSEFTPATSAQLRSMVAACFTEDEVVLLEGGPEVGNAVCHLPVDHIFFTGSTTVGRKVMQAAAEHLTPVTLELGGKSPVILHPLADQDHAIKRIATGKLLNAGQTCVAPDYLLLPGGDPATVANKLATTIGQLYPRLRDNPDYTGILQPRQRQRLRALVEDARKKGATIIEVNPASEDLEGSGKFPPTLIVGATAEMVVMQEEIFGPLLPILACPSLEAALARVAAGPRPLALYYFDHDATRIETVLQRSISGGVCINETMYHVAQEELPFGGTGASGMGAYHGFEGFRAFSHEKAVFHQSRLSAAALLGAPYQGWMQRLAKFLVG
ncbi:MAG TPA: coniferyl aldehyde dehydrogenase, partial [Myxococcota bacterium]|nr:coniferyl aldehyde dehydrogenase [Myxococcota bacterium]